ncbi:hypothetical protein J1N35_003784 [Gossypium stocksii]|uniref:Uncharacterized protein n=1 Tax=Gossypium stocksii TaxID=47602 RepID=A0A9D3WA82_9ROSI|nr:hypothetical protein J1N35_003784 [Gossypium stocksii]
MDSFLFGARAKLGLYTMYAMNCFLLLHNEQYSNKNDHLPKTKGDSAKKNSRFGHSREEKQRDERRKHRATTTVVENDNKGAAMEKMRMGRAEIQPQRRKKRRTEGTAQEQK